jgi:N-acetylneuraminic acid mutarotase
VGDERRGRKAYQRAVPSSARVRVLLLTMILLGGCLASPAAPTTSPTAPAAMQITGAWRSHASDPLPRYELAVGQAGPRAYVIGGLRATYVMTSTVEVYDAKADAWSLGPEYPGIVHHHGVVGLPDGSILSFGGWIGIGQSASDQAYKLSPGAAAWTPLPRMPQARGAHGAVLVEENVWLIGGTGLMGELLKSIDVFDPHANSWSAGPPLPHPRDHLAVVRLGDELWVLGGRERTLQTTSNATQVYNLTTKSWRDGPDLTMRRAGFAAAVADGRIVAMGGEDADAPRLKNQAEVYDPVAGHWSVLAPMLHARTGLGAAVWDGRVYAIGGADPSGLPNSDAPESIGLVLRPVASGAATRP